MSELIYSRAQVREQTIWPSFLYGDPFSVIVEADRVIIFGLYSGTYKYGHNYLIDIETEELQRIIDIYNNSMSQLSMEEQNLVIDLAARRYVFNVDMMIAEEQLETKRHKLTADGQGVDAKIAALEVDREELNTVRVRIELAKEIAENEIKKLEAEISLEIVQGEYADLEIAEKQLAAARAELKVLTTALSGLEIQIAIAETSLNIVEAEASKYQYKADIAGIDARIAETELTASQLAVDQAELSAMQYEISNLISKKIELIESGNALTEAEIAGIAIEQDKQLALHTARLGEMIARLAAQKQTNDDQEFSAETRKDIALAGDTLNQALSLNDKLSALRDVDYENWINFKKRSIAFWHYYRAIEMAEKLATADITNTLTHTISGS